MPPNEGIPLTRRAAAPRWLYLTAAALGFVWLVGALIYLLYTKVVLGGLGPGSRIALAGVCLSGLGFALSAVWPLGRHRFSLEPDEFWSFILSPPPQDESAFAVWKKLRRTFAFWLTLVLFMFAGVVANWAGY